MSDDTIDATGGDHVLLQVYVLRKTYESLETAADAEGLNRTEGIHRAIALYAAAVSAEPGHVINWTTPRREGKVATSTNNPDISLLLTMCTIMIAVLSIAYAYHHLWWGLGIAIAAMIALGYGFFHGRRKVKG
jgi:hypothetical protein